MIGLPAAVFIAFLVLKLTEVIDWSWWLVTLPLWGTAVIAIPFVLTFGVAAAWGTKKAEAEFSSPAARRRDIRRRNRP